MGPASRIQAQVNRELIDLSKKNELAATDSNSSPADKEEDDDGDEEQNNEPEEVIVADADEDESDEEEEREDAQEGEDGEDEEDEGGEISDEEGKEEEGSEEYMREEVEREELPTKSVKIEKKRTVAATKRDSSKKMGRGAKGGETESDDPIVGSGMKSLQRGIPAKKRKVVQFAPEPKVDIKRRGKSGKKTA